MPIKNSWIPFYNVYSAASIITCIVFKPCPGRVYILYAPTEYNVYL